MMFLALMMTLLKQGPTEEKRHLLFLFYIQNFYSAKGNIRLDAHDYSFTNLHLLSHLLKIKFPENYLNE